MPACQLARCAPAGMPGPQLLVLRAGPRSSDVFRQPRPAARPGRIRLQHCNGRDQRADDRGLLQHRHRQRVARERVAPLGQFLQDVAGGDDVHDAWMMGEVGGRTPAANLVQ
jgi:hypothetical protein